MAFQTHQTSRDTPLMTPEADKFLSEMMKGNLDTKELRVQMPYFINKIGWNVYTFNDNFGIGVINCSLCNQPSFVRKTISAYNDAHWVCEDCKNQYSWCQSCKTHILTLDIDNPSHQHVTRYTGGGVLFPGDEEKAVWNADIMTSKKVMFCKTPQERLIYKHRLENHKPENFRYFGVELEVEKMPGAPPDMLQRTYNMLSDEFVMVKHDGSLSNKGKGGFEIVSVPATMAYHKGGVWDKFYNHIGQFFQERPPTTGLHVHVGIDAIGRLTSGKMLLFINSEKNREFIERIAQRQLGVANPNGKIYAAVHDSWKISDLIKLKQHEPGCPWDPINRTVFNRYATRKDGTLLTDNMGNPIIKSLEGSTTIVRRICKCKPGMYKGLEKYEAFNLMTKRPTVELRIFRGIVSQFFLYVALEFADALADFCADSSPSMLSYRDFLNWMCKFNPYGRSQFPSLSRHLINEGWIDPPKHTLESLSKSTLESGGTAPTEGLKDAL